MVRSMKNAFAPVNRIPRDVLSIIPDYWADEDTGDEDLITLTHVCRGWRELFISRPSLWARLDCSNVEKTRVYIERSKSSPLKVCLREDDEYFPFLNDAFLRTVPYLGRLGSLTISGSSDNVVEIVNEYFKSPAPLLEKLKIHFTANPHAINAAILDGNHSSLRELRLSGVLTDLPWKNLANLTTFDFRHVPSNKISVTQLLDFFEYTPLLSKIKLWDALPTTSDIPLVRVVSLPHLKELNIINAQPVHSILLEHLWIPSGAWLVLEFHFDSETSPIPDYLPKTLGYLDNLSHVTSINLYCGSEMSLRLEGSSGGLYAFGTWTGAATSLPVVHRRVLRSLNHFDISMTERFMVTAYSTPSPLKIKKNHPYQTLLLMSALRTLILIDCLNVPFISALNPSQNPSGTLVCPELEELALYIKEKEWFCISELSEMVKERGSRGAGLSTITIFSPQEFVPAKEVLKLRDHVSYVEYRLDDVLPVWDETPDDVEYFGYESDW